MPNDPGKAPVAVPGILRLLLEIAYFSAAAWALFASGETLWAFGFAGLVLFHYLISFDRIRWLLSQPYQER